MAIDLAIQHATQARRETLRRGLRVVLKGRQEREVDLGLMDGVALRLEHRPYLLTRYMQANGPMWAARRLLEAIDEIRAVESTVFPALPVIPPKAPKTPRGVHDVHEEVLMP